MKAVVLLFILLAGSMILWGYTGVSTRKTVTKTVRKNLFAIVTAIFIVGLAVVFSSNVTLRLV